MTQRERVLTALNHREPDRVPFDFSATNTSGIAIEACRRLCTALQLDDATIEPWDVIQQLARPPEALLELMQTEFRGFLPRYYATIPLPYGGGDWQATHRIEQGAWIYTDEWGIVHRFQPGRDHYYSRVSGPLQGPTATLDEVRRLDLPAGGDADRFRHLNGPLQNARSGDQVTVVRSVCAGLFEVASRLRGMDNFLVDTVMSPDVARALLERVWQIKAAYWESLLDAMGTEVDIVAEADDYGTQQSLLISPDLFRSLAKPYWLRLFTLIKQRAPHVRIFFHSCGAVRPLIPDFIDMGVDILNPIHTAAAGMAPSELKRDFGSEICFWGGGIDTQKTLPHGSLSEIRDEVKRNIDALAPGGGWIFAPVHNIQADVRPQNILAMQQAFHTHREY